MKKSLYKKGLVFGTIILFFGAGITPSLWGEIVYISFFGINDAGTNQQNFENFLISNSVKMNDESGLATKIWLYVHSTEAYHKFKCALYDGSGNFIDETEEKELLVYPNQWIEFNFTNPVELTANTYYNITCWMNSTTGYAGTYKMNNKPNCQVYFRSYNYDSNNGVFPNPSGMHKYNWDAVSMYCEYETSNDLPSISDENPQNNSIDVSRWASCSVTVTDTVNGSLMVYFYENTTGSWVLQQTNLSVQSGANVVWSNYSNASAYDTKYWWRVCCFNGSFWVNETYCFTTITESQYGDNDWEWSDGSGITGDIYHIGNVGIGTTSPNSKLEVDGIVNATSFVGDDIIVTGDITASHYYGDGSTLTGIATDYYGGDDISIDDLNYISLNEAITIKNASNVYWANEYASSGTGGTGYANYWVDGIYNAYQNMTSVGALNRKGWILCPPGNYIETNTILVDGSDSTKPKHLSLVGFGFWNTWIWLADNSNHDLIKCVNQGSVYINGVSLYGNKDDQTKECPILNLTQSYDATIRDTFISSSKGWGIQLGDPTYTAWTVDIINSPIEYCDLGGINISNCANLNVEGCTIAHNAGYNIIMWQATGIRIFGNSISNEFNDSIVIKQRSGKTIEKLHVSNNDFYDDENAYNAIVMDTLGGNPQKSIITGNCFEGKYGITCTGNSFKYMCINDNTFECDEAINLTGGFEFYNGTMVNNWGLNPIGKYDYPFYETTPAYICLASSTDSTPSANKNYTVSVAPCRIISTGGTGVDINIYDGHGNKIINCGATCDEWLPIGWKINWGGYSVAPTVSVYFS